MKSMQSEAWNLTRPKAVIRSTSRALSTGRSTVNCEASLESGDKSWMNMVMRPHSLALFFATHSTSCSLLIPTTSSVTDIPSMPVAR